MKLHHLVLLGACLAPACRHALAQQADTSPDAENLLVTATRVPTPADAISAGITVIDRATIEARGDITLVDALAQVPGVHVVQSGGPGQNASLFVRGADSDQVQVLIDGVPVNDASGPGGAYNFGVATLDDVQRIEVVRGPMSALYGSGAIGGVVNIITERGGDGTHGDVTLAAGLPAAVLGQADLRGSGGAFDYSLSADSRSDRGFDATLRREDGYTGERDGSRSSGGGGQIGYTSVAGTRLFVAVQGRSSVFGYDDVGYPAFDDPDETGRDNFALGRAGITSALLGGAWHTGVELSRSQDYRRYVNLLDADDPNGAAEDSRYLGRRSEVQWNNTIALPDAGALHDTTLTAGVSHAVDLARQRLDSAYFGVPYIASVAASDHRDSGYAGVQSTLLRRLALTAAARQDSVSGVGGAFTWRVGGAYALGFLASHLKASYGTAFLAPSLFDRYGVDDDGYVGNPALKPERSRGMEVGWSGTVGPARIEVTWFHTQVRDLIQYQFVPVYTSINIDAARLQGIEAAVHLAPAPWLHADLTYTYTDARNAGTGTQLLRRPYDAGSASLELRPVTALTIVPQLIYNGDDRDELVDDQGYPAGAGRNRGGATVDVSARWQLRPHVSLFAWGRNLGDQRAEPASGYAPPGRSFLAGVRFSR